MWLLVAGVPCLGATFIWNGGGANANWSNGTNWIGGIAPTNNGTAAIVLAGSTRLAPNVDTAWSIGSLTFSNNAGAFVIGGNTLTIGGGGITNNSANGQTINNAITLATNQTWSSTSGSLTFGGNINNVTNLLTLAGSFNSFITSIISGTGGLTKLGTGTNYLSGANTYTGLTTISAGVINIQNNSALGSPTASATVASGATLDLQGGITVTNASLSLNGTGVLGLGALRSLTNNNEWDGPITLAAAATIGCDTNILTLGLGGMVVSNYLATLLSSGNITANGSIRGANGLTKTGVGTLTLAASNSYSGPTTVSAGVLNLQNGSALGAGGGTVVSSGAALQLQGGITVAGQNLTLSGTGITNSGALRNLSGSNAWSGAITLAATSTIGADAGTLNLLANITNSTVLVTFTNNGTILLNGVLGNGTGGLTKTGSGLLQLNGANTYTGATTVSAGTLQFGTTGSLSGATPVTVNAGGAFDLNGYNESILSLAGTGNVTLGGGTLTVNNTTATTFSGVISGAGNLVAAGPATFSLNSTNTYAGGTTINSGSISITNAAALGNPTNLLTLNGGTLAMSLFNLTLPCPVTLGTSGGTFNFGFTTLTLSGSIGGSGGLNLVGSGILALTGSNSYLGGTTFGAGTITVNSDSALGVSGGAVTLTNSATLTTAGSFASVRPFNLNSGTATFNAGTGFTNAFSGVISGAGALTKTGAGTLVLSGTNTYTGPTAVSSGALNLQNGSALGGGSGGTTVASGAQVQLQGGITLSGKNLTVSGTGLANNGALRNISGSNAWNGTITLAAASTIDADAGTLNLAANITNSTFLTTFTNNGTILLNGSLGGGSGGLAKTGTGLLSLGGANTYTGPTTVSGGTMQFGAPGSLSGATAVTVNAGGIMDLNGFNESILSLSGAGSVTLGGGTLMVNNTAATTFSGVMSGTGGLTKNGGATFTLSGVNTYTGGTTINTGAISIAAATGIGNATNALTLNGGTLITSATLNSARAITLGINHGYISPGGTTLTLSGTISGPGALMKIGASTLALTGTNTYLGGTTNTAGTISIGSDSALGNPSGWFAFATNSTLTTTASFTSPRSFFLNSGTATFSCGTGVTNTFSGGISGAGALTQSGAGVMVLGGNNTFTNILTIAAGTVRLGSSGGISASCPVVITRFNAIFDLNNFNATIGSLASAAGGGVTLGSGSLTAGSNNSTTTNSAVISGTGNFTKAGTGTLRLTGANTYTGTTTVSAGALQLGASTRIATTSPLVVNSGATFDLNNFIQTVASLSGGGNVTLGSGTLTAGNTNTATFSGAMSGTGAFTKIGTGTQVFSGTNSYSGATTVSVGNFQVNGSSANSAVMMASAATLSGNGTVGTVAGASGSTNAPGSTGPGTLNSGSQTWAGGENYTWEINNPAGVKGGSSGWDWMNISGTLTITATAATPFKINLVSLTAANAPGLLTNFDNTVSQIWPIASASGGINGFAPNEFLLVTNGFQNPFGAGNFSLSQSGNDLNLIFTSPLTAAFKGVQSGTLTSVGNGTNIATLATPVVPTNAFLLFNTSGNSSVPGGAMVRGSITASNTVTFVRTTTESSSMNIQWYVIEYSAGVRVQRGEVNQTNTVINVPLAPLFATNQAFVTWSKTPDPAETTFTDSDPVVGQITSVSNLQLRVTSAPSSAPVISWQVVEFQNAASIGVQQGSVTNLTGTNLVATARLGLPVNTNSTFILTGYRTSGSGTSIGARLLRAQLTSTTNITFDRSMAGAPDSISEIFWQAVQLNDGSTVQGGSVNFASGSAQTNVALLSINTNRAAAFASVQPVGGQNTGRSPSTGSVPGVGSATLTITSGTQMTMNRNNTSDQADIGWFVVGFGPGSLLIPATGGTAISADTTTNIYTSLNGPTYSEIQSGYVGVGTITLNAPAGFNFNTNAPLPSVIIKRIGGSGANSLNINGVASGTAVALTTVSKTNLTLTVTSASSNGVTCLLMWTNISVRPTAGTPLASGNLVSSGTSVVQGVTTNSTSWGYLVEVAGAASKLAIATQPSTAVTAGVDFPQQPVVQVQDQFGNPCTADNTDVVSAISSGTDTNNVNASVTAVGGVAAFSGMDYLIAQTNTITFSAPGLTSKTSGNISVSAAAASQVTVVTQPSATATAGAPFAPQPVIQIQDPFGNLCTGDNATVVTAMINQGSGSLIGTQTFTDVNGVVTFTNLSYQVAETITIDFTASGLATDTSSPVEVGAAAASQLVIQAQPSAIATAGVPFVQQPVIWIEDQFGNPCVTNNSTVVTASRNAGSGSGALQGGVHVTASAGVVAFTNLSHNVATTINLDFNSGVLTGATSGSISINPATVAQLAFATQPDAATVGSVFGIQPSLVTQDAFGNNSISGLANNLNVSLALTSGFGSLLGLTDFDIGLSAGNGTVTFTNLEIDFAGSKQLTASASGLTSCVSSNFTVAPGGQTITFGALSNQIYGVAPFPVSASASSGLPITFSIVSGPASVFSSNVILTGAGTVTVSASQPGNTNYMAATSVNQSFTVAPAQLGIRANDKNRVYGATNPVFTYTATGLVNGDTTSVLSGSPTLTTSAVTNSPLGNYVITNLPGTLTASNYTLSFTNGTLTVNQAGTFIAISSSSQTNGYRDSVTFTASLPSTATGNVTFKTNNAALSTSNLVNGLTHSLTITNLPRGTNLITAEYAGDANYLGSTNTFNQIVTNHPPAAATMTVLRPVGTALLIGLSDLATNWTDVDGDMVRLSGMTAQSTNHINLLALNWVTNLDGVTITNFNYAYIGYTNGPNVNDQIAYSINDGHGGTTMGHININLDAQALFGQQSINVGTNSNPKMTFYGVPGNTYVVQRSFDLSGWVDISTNPVLPGTNNPVFKISDTNNSHAYYRLKWLP